MEIKLSSGVFLFFMQKEMFSDLILLNLDNAPT